ncbi:trichohyalin-like [Sceloporus undulatus]|uniref:trichohyalin-like n=1 Tax=Sceloporus undulatus TaxID=8520 RepID=UPI001C4C23D4|nr:trichohyalin-like [Sceloporus undulatus]
MERMNTRNQTQKVQALAQNQRRNSMEKLNLVDTNQLILEKIENLSLNLSSSLSANLAKEMNNFKKEIKQEIRSDLKEIKQMVDGLTLEIQKTKQRVDLLEVRTEKLEFDYGRLLNKREEEQDERAVWEQKLREKYVKIRGLPEEKDEKLEEVLIPEIAKFLEKDPIFFDDEVDNIYRVNSQVAKQKGLPRDVAVSFVRKRTRDLFLSKHNETSFMYKNLELKILKDIPGRILRKRREYNGLTTFLRKEGLPYRWEAPEGVTFWWNKKRIKVSSPEQGRNFLRRVADQKKERSKEENSVNQTGRDEVMLQDRCDEEVPAPLNPDLQELLEEEEERLRREEEEEEEGEKEPDQE